MAGNKQDMTLLETTVLGIVATRSSHAYQIEKQIRERNIRERLPIGFSTIYSALKKLEKRGYLESHFEPQENLPGRRIYTVTPAGRVALVQQIKKSLSQPQRESSSFEVGLAFGTMLEKVELKEALSLYESDLSRLIQAKVREVTHFRDPNPLERALLLRPLTLWQAERKWIRELMSLLR